VPATIAKHPFEGAALVCHAYQESTGLAAVLFEPEKGMEPHLSAGLLMCGISSAVVSAHDHQDGHCEGQRHADGEPGDDEA